MTSEINNLLSSKNSKSEIVKIIKQYIRNKNILEASNNEGSKLYFEKDYLHAIRSGDTEYLYQLGNELYKKSRGKRAIKKILSIVNIL